MGARRRDLGGWRVSAGDPTADTATRGDGPAVGWLGRVALEDETTVAKAAMFFVEAGVSAVDWASLTTAERAAILAARRALTIKARADALEDAGQDLAAARLRAPLDGGSQRARLLARATAEGVAAALKRNREAEERASQAGLGAATRAAFSDDQVNAHIDEAFTRADARRGHGLVR